jgi:hypothetical protein
LRDWLEVLFEPFMLKSVAQGDSLGWVHDQHPRDQVFGLLGNGRIFWEFVVAFFDFTKTLFLIVSVERHPPEQHLE